jgi:glycerophosphoryl diester phosphodiesterase
MESQIVVMSLDLAAVQKMKRLRPAWKVGLLCSKSIGDVTRLEADFLAVNAATTTRQLVRQAHDQGKDVYVWTVNESMQMVRLLSLGVDGLITDEPALCKRIVDQASKLNPVERLLLDCVYLIGGKPRIATVVP